MFLPVSPIDIIRCQNHPCQISQIQTLALEGTLNPRLSFISFFADPFLLDWKYRITKQIQQNQHLNVKINESRRLFNHSES